MRIALEAPVMVLAKDKRENNGNTYYSIAVLQDSQAGSINCHKDVFDIVEPMKEFRLGLVYNDQYKSLSATSIIYSPVVNKSAPTK